MATATLQRDMSENYIVSARKYRPLTFDTVVGQSHITTTLKNAILHQQLAHAFLFCGPRGVGKTSCARILAKTINCEHPTADMEACGECSSCKGFKNNNLFNVFELDAASNNSVDDIRELTNQVRFVPQQGRYKVYIIDEVHMLSAAAFNAFLKTLEEPPPYAIFILATTEKHKILPTILSRCQIFDFKRITTRDIVLHLQGIAQKEGMKADEAALHVIAQKSEGCMRDALSMLDRISGFTDGVLTYSSTMEHLNLLDADFYFGLTDHLLSQDVGGALLKLDSALEKGFEGDTVVSGMAEHFRNLLLCRDDRMAKLLDVPGEHKRLYYEKANQAPPSFLISCLNVINDCELEYKNARNKRLHVEMCLIRLCYVLQVTASSAPFDTEGEKKNDSRVDEKPKPAPAVAPPAPPKPIQQPAARAQTPAPAAVAPGAASLPRDPAAAPRRISKAGFDVDALLNTAVGPAKQETKILTDEEAKHIFEQFRLGLQQSGQSINFAQFSMMRVEAVPPDEVKIICPSEFNENYAKAERTLLIEHFTKLAGIRVRITSAVVPDEAANMPQMPVVLSRTEVFDAMVRINPNLGRLKDALNMQIEY